MDDAAPRDDASCERPPNWREWAYLYRRPLLLGALALCAIGLTGLVIHQAYFASPDEEQSEAEKERAIQEQEKKKKKEQKKPRFEIGPVKVQPHRVEQAAAAVRPPRPKVKPGHWTSIVQEMKDNEQDFSGELEATVVDPRGQSVDLDRTGYHLTTSRPVSLPKLQPKIVEWTMFVPRDAPQRRDKAELLVPDLDADVGRMRIDCRLRAPLGGDVYRGVEPIEFMPAYQYHFVVLAKRPGDYAFLSRLPSLNQSPEDAVAGRTDVDGEGNGDEPQDDNLGGASRLARYQIILPRRLRTRPAPPLSSNPLAWTSVAYLLWDDFDADDLTDEQKQAMLDWLHWGGQLIVSGPNSLAALRRSFLEPYLPAVAGKTTRLDAAALAEINEQWGRVDDGKGVSKVNLIAPCEGIELTPHPQSASVPQTGKLLVERRVGRGRIVVSAFKLNGADRPGRTIEEAYLRLYDQFFFYGLMLGLEPPGTATLENDAGQRKTLVPWSVPRSPEIHSAVRFFSRDAGGTLRSNRTDIDRTSDDDSMDKDSNAPNPIPAGSFVVHNPFVGDRAQVDSAGQWNDFSAVSDAARGSLRTAAGIKVPDATFVLWIVGGYLVVLVPINWIVFRLLGRVEWAWFSVPLLAVVCAAVVVRLAQLDIGFARSRTEVTVVELHGGYARAHVTRYTALYTSLSTGYDVRFADPAALVQPLAKGADFRMLLGQSTAPVHLRRDGEGTSLAGFQVASNSTGMLHSEQMLDVGGTMTVEAPAGDGESPLRVHNDTDLSLDGAAVVNWDGSGGFKIAWIGPLRAHSVGKVQNSEVVSDSQRSDAKHEDGLITHQWRNVPSEGTSVAAKRLNLADLIRVAEDQRDVAPGEMRLIGWTQEAIPGMDVDPPASQSTNATLVIVHLQFANRANKK